MPAYITMDMQFTNSSPKSFKQMTFEKTHYCRFDGYKTVHV